MIDSPDDEENDNMIEEENKKNYNQENSNTDSDENIVDEKFLTSFSTPPPPTLPPSDFISYTSFHNQKIPPYGCFVTLNYPHQENQDINFDSSQQEKKDAEDLNDSNGMYPSDHQIFMKELWKYYSLIIIKGDQPLTPMNELKLLRHYQELVAKEGNIDDEYNPNKYDELNKSIEQLQYENYRLNNELNDAKLTISHLQDDIKLEKHKNLSISEQLSTFHELEEYSAGLRDECSKHEDLIADLKSKLTDMEKSYSSLNTLNNDLQTEKSKLNKELQEKEAKIESLEKELWSRHLKGNSPLVPPLKSLHHNGTPPTAAKSTSVFRRSESERSDTDSPYTSPRLHQPSPRQHPSPKQQPSPRQPSQQPSPKQPSPKKPLSPTSSFTFGSPISPGDVTNDKVFSQQQQQLPVCPIIPPINLDSVLKAEEEVVSSTNPNLSRMMQEMEESNRRLLSRLKFLDSRLEIKEEAIRKLNSRIEEVVTERDSFREAMKELLVDMNNPSTDPLISPRNGGILPSTSSAEEGNVKSNSPNSRKKKSHESSANSSSSSTLLATTTTAVVAAAAENPNWQSAVSVVGSFLSGTQNQSSLSTTNSSKAEKGYDAAALQTIQSLELEIQRLKKYNFEIQKAEIKKLKSQIEELEKSLENANLATVEAEKWADNEFEILENQINNTIKEKNELYDKLELNKIEMERLQKQISRLTMKSSSYEEKVTTLNHRIELLEKELKETKVNAINPEEFTNLQNRVQELMGESKHWQQKAMSLSKEMQRSMSIQMELNRLQQEISTAKARMEELEAERTAFRDAMQQAISVSSHQTENPTPTSDVPRTGWLSKIL